MTRGKPAPDIYLHAAEALGIDPAEAARYAQRLDEASAEDASAAAARWFDPARISLVIVGNAASGKNFEMRTPGYGAHPVSEAVGECLLLEGDDEQGQVG